MAPARQALLLWDFSNSLTGGERDFLTKPFYPFPMRLIMQVAAHREGMWFFRPSRKSTITHIPPTLQAGSVRGEAKKKEKERRTTEWWTVLIPTCRRRTGNKK